MQTAPLADVSQEIATDLDDPVVVKDPKLRLRALTVKGDIDLEWDVDAAQQSWQQVQQIARELGEKGWEVMIVDTVRVSGTTAPNYRAESGSRPTDSAPLAHTTAIPVPTSSRSELSRMNSPAWPRPRSSHLARRLRPAHGFLPAPEERN